MREQNLIEAYENMYASVKQRIDESSEKGTVEGAKSGTKPGDLDGPAKGVVGDGPDVEGVEKKVTEPAEFSSTSENKSKKKSVKEAVRMPKRSTFDSLYKAALNEDYDSEDDLETGSYDDELGDFPPAEDEPTDELGGECTAEEKLAELAGKVKELYDALHDYLPDEDEVDDLTVTDTDEYDVDAAGDEYDDTMGEAVSEPEPKPAPDTDHLSGDDSNKAKLDVKGTKPVRRTARGEIATGHDGEPKKAKETTHGKPAASTPLKANAKGAIASAKASAFETP